MSKSSVAFFSALAVSSRFGRFGVLFRLSVVLARSSSIFVTLSTVLVTLATSSTVCPILDNPFPIEVIAPDDFADAEIVLATLPKPAAKASPVRTCPAK